MESYHLSGNSKQKLILGQLTTVHAEYVKMCWETKLVLPHRNIYDCGFDYDYDFHSKIYNLEKLFQVWI